PGLTRESLTRNSSSGVWSRFELTLAGDIVLHNRPWLLNELRQELADGRTVCDGELTLAAYAKWGQECPGHLCGEFSFAIWDSRERLLFCCRDQMGSQPFLYFLDQSRVVFVSDPRKILGLPGVPRKANLRKVSALAVPGGLRLDPEETFHSGIRSLPPGAWMIVDRRGARGRTYWRPEIREDLV